MFQSSKKVGPNFDQNKGYLRGPIMGPSSHGSVPSRDPSSGDDLPWNRTRVPSREGENISHPRGVSANHRLKKRQTVGRRICYMLVSRIKNNHNNKSIKNYNNSKEIPHYTTKPKRNLLSSTSRKTSTAPFLCDQIVSRDHELLSLHVQDLHCLPCHCQNTPLVFCFFPL